MNRDQVNAALLAMQTTRDVAVRVWHAMDLLGTDDIRATRTLYLRQMGVFHSDKSGEQWPPEHSMALADVQHILAPYQSGQTPLPPRPGTTPRR